MIIDIDLLYKPPRLAHLHTFHSSNYISKKLKSSRIQQKFETNTHEIKQSKISSRDIFAQKIHFYINEFIFYKNLFLKDDSKKVHPNNDRFFSINIKPLAGSDR